MKEALLIIICLLGLVVAGSPRLPRTSADQRSTRNVPGNGSNITGNTLSPNPRSAQRNREQYLFNVFEVIVSTLESKLQRIENLDKAVEHLMRRVEALDSRVNDNIDKTDSVITKLRSLDLKLFSNQPVFSSETVYATKVTQNESEIDESAVPTIRLIQDERAEIPLGATISASASVPTRDTLGEKLLSLDQKVSDIDNKLVDLKNQLDNNILQNDDINAEASEKKPVSMSVIEITKAMSNEVMNHVSIEIENLRQTTGNMDRKLQFHMNIVAENLGAVYNMMSEVHEAVLGRSIVNPERQNRNHTSARSSVDDTARKQSKIDRLLEHAYPLLSLPEKVDQVLNIVVGAKTGVDVLLPKSDQLLTQVMKQERVIDEIHADFKLKSEKIIENLEGVENRLQKQENDVATLAQRPIPAELLLDPTIDRLIEYDPSRYDEFKNDEFSTERTTASFSSTNSSTIGATGTVPSPVAVTPGLTAGLTVGVTATVSATSAGSSSITPVMATTASNSIGTTGSIGSSGTVGSNIVTTETTVAFSSNGHGINGNHSAASTTPATTSTLNGVQRTMNKNRGVIFPSVKNKPSPANSTFTTDVLVNYKDIKGYSCIDLLNAGMRDSGVYYLQIRGTTYWFLKVYCEQEIADGGWTVIQRRDDYGEPRESFNRDWADYKNGFGDPGREFWLGNENIYMLTNNEDYMLRVELEDFEGNKRYAQYSHFKIYSEAEYYKLEIDGYEGNAGDSLNDPWYGSNNSPFSTYNRDNDRSSLNCASMLKGGWWWKSCGRGLNGLYLNDPQDLTARQGIVWFRWRGWDYTLKRATMMIRPKGAATIMGTAAT